MKFRKHNTRSADLTAPEVLEIRRLYHKEGWTQRQLSHQFDVAAVTIGRIVRGESWRHLPMQEEPDPIKLSHAEPIDLPQDLQDKLMKELAAMPSADEPITEDAIERYLKEKGEGK